MVAAEATDDVVTGGASQDVTPGSARDGVRVDRPHDRENALALPGCADELKNIVADH
ncbi:hypothetical protein ACQPXS_02890 [Streptomyces sp. CA-142005]|uniref:hypothetical protein n=1 Tax=Streptomyces sp. CA-142005 TaxID=3240052 RepID=UPI003D89F268